MIIAMAILKQFFGSMRLRNNMSKMMKVISEFALVRYRYKINAKSNYHLQYWESSQIDLVEECLLARNITVKNVVNSSKCVTQNNIIMEYAACYVVNKNDQCAKI